MFLGGHKLLVHFQVKLLQIYLCLEQDSLNSIVDATRYRLVLLSKVRPDNFQHAVLGYLCLRQWTLQQSLVLFG